MRHSLADYSLNLPEEQYHSYPAWSYSIIAKYAKEGFSSLSTLHDKVTPTPSMEFGSLFDSILTKGRKTLDDYAVVDFSVPEAERKVLDALATKTDAPFFEVSMTTFLEAADSVSYQMRWKPETRFDKVSKYSDYYDNLRSGKKLVSTTDGEDALEMARIFRSDAYLKTVFGTKNTDDVEYIYQAQFVVDFDIEFETVKVKFMPDLIIVNHRDKTIRLVDLKTSAMPGYEFADNFLKYRYDIQGQLYSDGIKKIIAGDVEYSDYTVLPYLFTDISRSDKVPVTYEIDLSNGFSFSRGDKVYEYKGWKELLAEILVYEANEAKVPNYIRTDGPNDLIEILSR